MKEINNTTMKTVPIIRKEYRRDILGNKYLREIDFESDDHEDYCHVFTTAFSKRTLYTCNCHSRPLYRENFVTNRTNLQPKQ